MLILAVGEGHAEDCGLLPTGADDDQLIQQLANMICDPSSSSFVLRVNSLRGIGVWCWNPQEEEPTDIEKGRIIWRIGVRCHNIFCWWYRHQSFH